MEKTGKICSKCKELKDYSEFYKRKDSKDGYRNQCKKCILIERKQYQIEHKDSIAKQKRIYTKINKEKIAKKQQMYLRNNKERVYAQRKQYRLENKEILKEQYERRKLKIKQWQKDNADSIKKVSKEYRKKNKEALAIVRKLHYQNVAKYATYKDRLTIDESPRLAKDNVSIEAKCKYCNQYFTPTNLQIINRIQALNGNVGGDQFLYCSEHCKKACPTYRQIKYPRGFKVKSSREVNPLVRQMCFERDNWTCQECGLTQKDAQLHCHHLNPVASTPLLSNDVSNTLTLCKECHKEAHRQPGMTYQDIRKTSCNTK